MKKFPGKVFSLRLLYVRSKISKAGNAPKPLGKEFNLLMETLRILNFGKEEMLTGNSSI